ncbi:MAG: hypothetical protein HDT40_03170 [Lachnospiraceae bacterium]|nr:hypothetical protein [Lachnospiraceae bacterium]
MKKWKKLMKYTKLTFGFDIRKERMVYLFLCEKKKNKKLTADKKFYNYKSWRLYIIKKFGAYGKDSLIEFDKMLNYLIRDSAKYNRFMHDIFVAIITVLFTLFISGFTDININTMEKNSLIMVVSAIIGIIIMEVFFAFLLVYI